PFAYKSVMARVRRKHVLLMLLAAVGVASAAVVVRTHSAFEPRVMWGITLDVEESVILLEVYDGMGESMGRRVGFIVEPGHIVTNRHCIEHAESAWVLAPDGRRYKIEGVIADGEDIDIAVLKANIPNSALPRLRWAETDA